MKRPYTRLLLVAAVASSLTRIAGAFTLDFAEFAPGPVPSGTSHFIENYGEVYIYTYFGGLEAGTQYSHPSLQFDATDEEVQIHFPQAISDITWLTAGENTELGEHFNAYFNGNSAYDEDQGYTILSFILRGSVDGAGIRSVTFESVPEPGGLSLGLLSGGMLFARRRRLAPPRDGVSS